MRSRFVLGSSLLVALLCAAPPAGAQEQEAPAQDTIRTFELDPVVVSASKRTEKALSAPARVEVVGTREVEERPAVTVVDHVKSLPGVDVASTGLVSSNVVTRGFNNVFSGALLMITDNRISAVPSLRVNAPYMIPATNEDIERMEVLLGPAAALYGPNSANGVLHVITRSPFDSPGTTVSLTGGERSFFQGSLRHAGVLGDRVGFKVSGQYFTGDDWEYVDPVEAATRTVVLQRDPSTRIGLRDYGVEGWKGDARVDYRPTDRTEAIFSVGTSHSGSGIELTGLGAAQVRDWRYSYYQARVRHGNLFAQVFANTSDAGETYLLRTGQSIVDDSRMIVGQLQHVTELGGDRQRFTYGMDYQRTEPRTGGTILGRNEGVKVTEVGGYLQSETRLSRHFDFVAAGRLDHHDYVDELVFSPRAALVVKPRETQTVRFTYNRAFETPTSNNLFLDLEAGNIIPNVLSVRTVGVPTDGLHFRRDCAGGVGNLCMRSGFASQAGYMPANAALLWPVVVQLMKARGVDLSKLPAPGPGDVATVLRVLNPTGGTFHDVDPSGVTDIEAIRPTITNTFEVGYKGLLSDRLLVSADVYHTRKNDFVGPLIVETPNVFFDPASLAAYLSRYMHPAQAQALAAGIGGISGGDGSATKPKGIPLGTVTPDHELTGTPDIFLTYRNFGEVELWGADFAAQYLLGDRFSVSGSYSFASENYFTKEEVGGLSDVALNAPQHKGSVGGLFRDDQKGVSAELRARYNSGFPMNSGVYIGDVDPYTLLDASVGYRLPFAKGALFSISAQNLLNAKHSQFVGAPVLGRMVLTRIQYSF